MSDDYLERWNEESGDLDLLGRLDLMADEFFIDDSTENLALHEAAAEVRTLLDALEASEAALVEWGKLFNAPEGYEPTYFDWIQAGDLRDEALAKLKAFRSGTGGDE